MSGRRAGRLVVVSLDGLATADLEEVRGLPSFRRLLRTGALCRRVRGVYPTQTYALHASALTGVRPARHGILANTRFQPGRERPEWFCYRSAIRLPTLYDRAMAAGLSTASLFWPTAGRSGQRWVLPEITAAGPWQSLVWRVLSAGTPLFLVDMLRRYGSLLRGLDRLISEETGLPVTVAQEPMKAVAQGTGMILQEMDTLSRAVRSSSKRSKSW